MCRSAQHEDIRAGAENPLFEAGDHDDVHFGVLEAEPLDGVGQLDVDREIVRVSFRR